MAAIKALEEVPVSAPGSAVRGRNGYENYGAIRTKPGRADSPPTISFSCSDKIATWSVLGLQGAMLEPLFEPVYLTGVVVGGVEEVGPKKEELRELIKPEIERAIWGRLEKLEGESISEFSISTLRSSTNGQTAFLDPSDFRNPKSSLHHSTFPTLKLPSLRYQKSRLQPRPFVSPMSRSALPLRRLLSMGVNRVVYGKYPVTSLLAGKRDPSCVNSSS
jgi:hypothetical protein